MTSQNSVLGRVKKKSETIVIDHLILAENVVAIVLIKDEVIISLAWCIMDDMITKRKFFTKG